MYDEKILALNRLSAAPATTAYRSDRARAAYVFPGTATGQLFEQFRNSGGCLRCRFEDR